MKTRLSRLILLTLSLCLIILPTVASAAGPGDQYCITPPFITAGIKPNLLLMIDNSASMYDLAYVDKGKKHCSATTARGCFYDSDCPTGETCSVFDRTPYYCFDQTFSSTKICSNSSVTTCSADSDCGANNSCVDRYAGYFDNNTYYHYRSGTDDFAPVASAFPSGCPTSGTNITKTIANTMCLEYVPITGTMVTFIAKGNYLNWLTSSKFDIEKKILIGGKYDGASSSMVPESRGCVGRGYIKMANDSDFVNFSGDAENDTNNSIGVTFTVTGEADGGTPNLTAPSTGGQTYINLYAGATYNYADCQDAIDAIASGGNADIKKTVDACLSAAEPTFGKCQQDLTKACTTSSECLVNSSLASSVKVCKDGTSVTCTSDADCTVAARFSCQLNTSMACTGLLDTTSCKSAAVQGTCGAWSPALANGSKPPTYCDLNAATGGNASTTVDNGDGTYSCKYKKSNETDYHYASCNYVPAADKGPCVSTVEQNFGSCISNNFGPCLLPSAVVEAKSKVAFQQSMQACWALRNGTPIGVDDINTVINQCSDVYGQTAPSAITAGSHALLCGAAYEGQFYEQNAANAWVLKSGYDKTSTAMKDVHTAFCNEMSSPNVTDPTDAPSNSPTTDSLPAIISGIGVEAQLGAPKAKMRARLVVSTPACTTNSNCSSGMSCDSGTCKPSGLVQQFGGTIRLGALSFNQYGSASETALTGTPRTCKSGSQRPGAVCNGDPDCDYPVVAGNCTSTGTTNLDGARILYPIGLGYCATMTTTPCTDDTPCGAGKCMNNYCGSKGTTVCTTVANCSGANQACIANSVGNHSTAGTLIKNIDAIKANAWTPFSEAYYTAIGYFGRISYCSNDTSRACSSDIDCASPGICKGKSRTALRLNSLNPDSTDFSTAATAPTDFNEILNPSEMRCQQNYTMLISDGSSTADRNTNVSNLATLYATPAGITQTTCTGAPVGTTTDYGGNNNLPIMTWLARNRNISDFNLSGTASTATPPQARDSITSYVVFNGESNGAAGDCNSLTLLDKAAKKGGTEVKQAKDYDELVEALTSVFQDVAAKAASGTAASILSNSEGSGANILQAVFYPKKIFENDATGTPTFAYWIGEMQNLWYFVDPYINNSTIREDTDEDRKLNLVNDYVARFAFDNSSDRTMVQRMQDNDGDGTGDVNVGGMIDPDYVKSIWRAGKLLWSRNISTSPRTIKTTLNGTSLVNFSTTNAATLAPYLNVAAADAPDLISWVQGQDNSTMRNRVVRIKDPVTNVISSGTWRLGDIISSTPRVQSTVRLNTYNLPPPGGYKDKTYETFINSSGYQDRGMVYVGANDGMFHAFKLGKLSVKAEGAVKATLTGTDLGKEEWAFIPKNYLPYLNYMASRDYDGKHFYAVDGRTSIFDASIGDDGSGGNYWEQTKTASTWRTVVIGAMGIGGASRRSCTGDVACVQTPVNDPADTAKSLGYSSYFALDVTNPESPALLWEFSDDDLGYSTTGPAIVRVGDRSKNGRWFAVFGNGPFGPINTTTQQFKGYSDHHLRFFIVDLATGELVRTITTTIDNAFAGSMLGASIDADRRDASKSGNYQDDAVYAGYVKQGSTANWSDGGVIRILTKENLDPAQWVVSTVIDGIGPVTTSIARTQDTRPLSKNLWLYFGTGRYYFRDGTGLDDYAGARTLFGIKEPCYNTTDLPGNVLDPSCTTAVTSSLLVNQTDSISAAETVAAAPGWRINLEASTETEGAERVVTDTVALTNGVVYFTSFKPTMDVCGYGGNSFLWGVKYDTGGQAAANALTGKALIQLSTGEFREVDLSEAFTAKLNRRMDTPMTGKPPSDAPPIISNSQNKPLKKILHIQER